jgi:hypothetical protein
MIKLPNRTNGFALVAICCALGVLSPTESFASLNNIACKAIRRGCNADCNAGDQSQSCYDQCLKNYQNCFAAGATKKQQSPPPPCTGIRCTLRPTHPPTTVSDPAHPPRHPIEPVNPVGVSNPNKTESGNSGPVILLRKNDSGGGGQGHGHGH